MDWPTYKSVCDRPDVFSRWMLLQTKELLREDRLVERVDAALAAPPIAKPDDHTGDPMTDMFVVAMEREEIEAIARVVAAAAAQGLLTSGTRARPRALAGFEAAWTELLKRGSHKAPVRTNE